MIRVEPLPRADRLLIVVFIEIPGKGHQKLERGVLYIEAPSVESEVHVRAWLTGLNHGYVKLGRWRGGRIFSRPGTFAVGF